MSEIVLLTEPTPATPPSGKKTIFISSTGALSSVDSTGAVQVYSTGPGTGTVSSVALGLPSSVFTVTGSPVTSSGTLTGSFTTQATSTVFAGPTSGSAIPTFRQLSATDLSNGVTGTGLVVLQNSPALITPALGTPSSGVATNLTGTAAGLTAGNVTTNANLTGVITSIGNTTSIAAQTGTGATFVVQTSPTLTTPVLGVATATTINNVTFTPPATGSTLTIVNGKTLTANNSLTLSGTDSTTMTFPTTSATIARTDAAQTFTGLQSFNSVAITGGSFNNGSISNTSVNGTVGATTPSSGVFTSLSATSGINSTTIGASTPAAANFTNTVAQSVAWSSTGASPGDIFLQRDAANTLAQRNGTTAQSLRVYNTFTDASNYERGVMEWVANNLTIGMQAAGTGTVRGINFQTNGAMRWTISGSAGNLVPATNGTVNIGAANIGVARLYFDYTNTATVGAVTINKASGRVNIAAAGTSVVVTNSVCTVNAHVFATITTNDLTATIKNVVPAAGSFTITLGAAATAQTSIDFFIVNAD